MSEITLEKFKEVARNSKDTKDFIKKVRQIKGVPGSVVKEFASKYRASGETIEQASEKFMNEFGSVKSITINNNQKQNKMEKEKLQKQLEVAKKVLADTTSPALKKIQEKKVAKLEEQLKSMGAETKKSAPKKEAKKSAPKKEAKKSTPKKEVKKSTPKKEAKKSTSKKVAVKKEAPTKKEAISTIVEGEAQVKALKSKFPKGTKVEFIDVRNKKTVKGNVISFAYSKQRNGQYRLNAFVDVAGKKKKVRAAKLTK